MSDDMPSGKEFFEAARKELGYEPNLLCDGGETYMGREADGEYCIEVQHDCRCDESARSLKEEIKGLSAFRPQRVYLDDAKVRNWTAYVRSQPPHIAAKQGMER